MQPTTPPESPTLSSIPMDLVERQIALAEEELATATAWMRRGRAGVPGTDQVAEGARNNAGSKVTALRQLVAVAEAEHVDHEADVLADERRQAWLRRVADVVAASRAFDDFTVTPHHDKGVLLGDTQAEVWAAHDEAERHETESCVIDCGNTWCENHDRHYKIATDEGEPHGPVSLNTADLDGGDGSAAPGRSVVPPGAATAQPCRSLEDDCGGCWACRPPCAGGGEAMTCAGQKCRDAVILPTPPWLDGHPDGVCVDGCIAATVAHLWSRGVQTLGSCCGHGSMPPSLVLAQGETYEAAAEAVAEVDDREFVLHQWHLVTLPFHPRR